MSYLFEYLAKGKDLATFLDDFDGVTREQAVAALELARKNLLPELNEI